MDAWAGKVIVLYSTMVDLRGQMVPALRVRILPPKQATAAPQQPAASQQPAAPSQPIRSAMVRHIRLRHRLPSLRSSEPSNWTDELDDEIPF